jgi:uncharacterized protein
MLYLLSPAKTLDYETPWSHVEATDPLFVEQAQALIGILRKQSKKKIAELMDLSDALAQLNVDRYREWQPQFTEKNSKPALLAFNGDVYEGLNAQTLKPKQLEWAQSHVAILSGLYGVLRPLDKMQAYRLEMGTSLSNPKGPNLYHYWGSQLSLYINERLEKEKNPVIINLASQEYFKAVDKKTLLAKVVTCEFQDFKNGQYKVISFFAKRARGLMARFAIENRINTPAGLQQFNLEGYCFDVKSSTANQLMFRRKLAD